MCTKNLAHRNCFILAWQAYSANQHAFFLNVPYEITCTLCSVMTLSPHIGLELDMGFQGAKVPACSASRALGDRFSPGIQK